jgi:3D (Asp-Asp-Asp) domain-containing protein
MRRPLLLLVILLVLSLLIALLLFPAPLTNGQPTNTVRLEITRAKLNSWLAARRPPTLKPVTGSVYQIISSAYAPSPYQTDSTPCITAAGTRVRPGTAASNFLPLGTILEINDNIYIVEDRMHPRYYYAIDIFFPSTSEALSFGRQKLEVKILGYGRPGQPLVRDNLSPEPIPIAETEPDLTLVQYVFDNARSWQTWAGTFLGARSPDVNRYDVDCFSN